MTEEVEKPRARLAMRASTRFLMQSIEMMLRAMGGRDLLRATIFLAIVDANTRHLEPSDAVSQTYSETEDTIPDNLRRPISVHALALSLELPYETTRRHVNALLQNGYCRRRENGVFVPGEVLSRENFVATHEENLDNLRGLFANLKAGGVRVD